MGVDSAPGTRRHHGGLGPYGRRIGDGWDAGSRRVLLGLPDAEAAGRLAKMFEASAALPTLVFSCEHLVREAREGAYGLIVLDGRFACAHDLRCLREVREASPAPIMTVGEADEDSVEILEMALDPQRDRGAIVRRGTALIDMSRPVRLTSSIRWGPLELDVELHEARWGGRYIRLTVIQFRILEVLALAGGSILSVEQLGRRVWGDASVRDRDRLVQHVRRIRKLIEEDPSRPRFLLRVRGGFRLSEGEIVSGAGEGPNEESI